MPSTSKQQPAAWSINRQSPPIGSLESYQRIGIVVFSCSSVRFSWLRRKALFKSRLAGRKSPIKFTASPKRTQMASMKHYCSGYRVASLSRTIKTNSNVLNRKKLQLFRKAQKNTNFSKKKQLYLPVYIRLANQKKNNQEFSILRYVFLKKFEIFNGLAFRFFL